MVARTLVTHPSRPEASDDALKHHAPLTVPESIVRWTQWRGESRGGACLLRGLGAWKMEYHASLSSAMAMPVFHSRRLNGTRLQLRLPQKLSRLKLLPPLPPPD